MKKKILALLCAICACAMNFMVSFCPTASAATPYLKYGTSLQISGNHPGNIFFGNESIVFGLDVENKNDSVVYGRYSYTIKDESDKIIYESVPTAMKAYKSGQSGMHKITLPTEGRKYGKFTLTLTEESNDTDSTENTVKAVFSIPFSVCIKLGDSNINEDFGFNQTLVNADEKYLNDAKALVSLMKNSGARWHREDVLWNGVENTQEEIEARLVELGYTAAYHTQAEIEAKRHELKYNDLERYVDRLKFIKNTYGIKTVCILKGTHDDYDGGDTPVSDTAVDAFADFCAYVASELKGVVDHYEIWNEWNIKSFNPSEAPPEDYARLLKASYKAINNIYKTEPVYDANGNKIKPVIIGCDTAGIPYQQSPSPKTGWIYRVLEWLKNNYNSSTDADLDNKYCMDAMSVHCYDFNGPASDDNPGYSPSATPTPAPGFPEQKFRDKVNNLKGLLQNYDLDDLPIWLTECGFSTYSNTTEGGENPDGGDSAGCTEDVQLNSMVMLNVVNKAYGLFDNVIQYCFSNRGIDKSAIQENWGVLYNWQTYQNGNLKSGAKSSYLGLAAMNYFIGGDTEFESDQMVASSRQYAFTFNNHTLNKKVTVVIAGGFVNTSVQNLNIGSSNIDIYDKYGNLVGSRHSDTGIYSLTVSTEPIYIVCGPKIIVKKGDQIVTSGAGLSKGDTLNVSVNSSDLGDAANDPAVIAAQYDEKGKLITNDKFTSETDFSGDIIIAPGTRRIKVVFWDMEGLKPITACYDIQ